MSMDSRQTEISPIQEREGITVADRVKTFLGRHLIDKAPGGVTDVTRTVALRFIDLMLLKNAVQETATGNYLMAGADVAGIGILHAYDRIKAFLLQKVQRDKG